MRGIVIIGIIQLNWICALALPTGSTSRDERSLPQSVPPANDNEMFTVTDEKGVPFVVSMNDIIQSLSELSDQEIIQMLQESEQETQENPVHVQGSSKQVVSPLPQVKHENLDNIDENDVVLIENEEGDIRLLTVNDVLTSYGHVGLKHHQVFAKNTPTTKPQSRPTIQHHKREVSNKDKPQVQIIIPSPTPKPTLPPQQQNKEKEAPNIVNSHVYETIHSFAPNSPPVKLLEVPGSLNSQHRNTISITTTSSPPGFGKGIRDVFSRLVSRVMGDTGNSPKQQQPDTDQYVQIVMPSSDPYNMEQIRIPLPKPIHYSNVHRRSFKVTTTTPGPLLNFRLGSDSRRKNDQKSEDESKSKVTDSREQILESAKIPKSVQQKVLEQMEEPPLLLAKLMKKPSSTNRRMDTGVPENEPIDRLFREKKKKTLQYKYEFPAITVIDHPPPPHPLSQIPQYSQPSQPVSYSTNHIPVHTPHAVQVPYSPEHSYGEDQPLVDISILADIVNLAKWGKDNESYSFPRIGDPSKFIEVREHKH